jgi:TPR repeat protein
MTGVIFVVLLSVSSAMAGALDDCAAAYDRQDYMLALRLCRPLAEQGDAKAHTSATCILQGEDDAEALKWLIRAADQGDAVARNQLGFMYSEGHGVTQDYAEAVKWCRKAADQGWTEAQLNLGVMYGQRHGVPQDYALA